MTNPERQPDTSERGSHWRVLREAFESGSVVAGPVGEVVKGGLTVVLGVRAFLPASQIEIGRPNELSSYVGERVRVRVLELDPRRGNLVVSRRVVLQSEAAARGAATLVSLRPGASAFVSIRKLLPDSLVVDLDGVAVSIQAKDIHLPGGVRGNWFQVGDDLEVHICDVDPIQGVILKVMEAPRVGRAPTGLGPATDQGDSDDVGHQRIDFRDTPSNDAAGVVAAISRAAVEGATAVLVARPDDRAQEVRLRQMLRAGEVPEVDYARSTQTPAGLLLRLHHDSATPERGRRS
jgi:hypothetical protein